MTNFNLKNDLVLFLYSINLIEYQTVCSSFQSYCAVFASGELPTPKDMLEVCTYICILNA
jgi:hypothetical protein